MSARSPRGTVYSTSTGTTCPKCGWPAKDCRCSSNYRPDEPVPDKQVAKLRIEKSGRSGKTVTVVDGLPKNRAFLDALATELKRACGTGGTATQSTVELQGDHRERLRPLLAGKGWTVKG
ncbi:MAG: hypothetical protein AMXMBFR36_09580 [Acidobacteriota bacterium]